MLTSGVGGSGLPFWLGHGLRKGDVPAGQTLVVDGVSSQVVPISTWDDGSQKHVLIAGRADFVANTARSCALKIGSVSGAALSESDLIAAAPTATISYGTYGSVSLAALLGTSALTVVEHAGPQYAAFQYIASFPSDAGVRAVFYVQLWSGKRYRVRIAVENGISPGTSTGKRGTASVSVAGVQRFSAVVSMPWATRWDVVGFDGVDPDITPKHDTVYLRATKLVPNYGWPNVDAGTVSALSSNYTPLALLGWSSDMGSTGAQFGIGLLPHWDATYCCIGSAQAYKAVLAHGRAYGTYSCFYRNPTTRKFPKPNDHPSAYNTFDGGSSEDLSGNGTNPYRWEMAHVPNGGYLPWLLTAERFHLETMQANTWATWLSGSTGEAAGTARQSSSQTRARGWRVRNVACCAALSPDGDPIKADWQANLVALLDDFYQSRVLSNSPGTGLVGTYDDKDTTAGFQHSIFESAIVMSSINWAWDLEPGLSSADKTMHRAVCDHANKAIVGLFGRGPANGEFSWRRATGPYRMVIGSGSSLSTLYDSWLEVHNATYGDSLDSSNGLPILDAYADDPSTYAFGEGVWGYMITALAYAVDHGAAGASAGWARLTSASNWASNTNKFVYRPQHGIMPRS